MKIFITFCRILVGGLFIVSGLIKVNDAIGFSYKLEEYFSEKALGFPDLIPYALPIAVFIVVAEVLLGVATLLGAWPKLTSTLILAMTIFFTWLTFYTSHCDPHSLAIFTDPQGKPYIDNPECVLTCGCFGDAIKLKPIESFYKDVVLLIFIVPLFFAALFGKFKLNTLKEDGIILIAALLVVAGFSYAMLDWMFPVLFTLISFGVGVLIKVVTKEKQWLMALGVLLVCALFQYWTLVHLPLKDYRPYAIGSSIIEKMKSADELGKEPPKVILYYKMKNKTSGEIKEVSDDVYMKIYKDTNLEIVPGYRREEIISEGYVTPIQDFSPANMDGEVMTDQLLAEPRLFLLVSNNLDECKTNNMAKIIAFAKAAEADGAKFYGISPAGYDTAENFRHDNQTPFEFLVNDNIELKIIIRSNPGLVYIENGTVVNMWSNTDIPDYQSARSNGFKP
jgi:uncharacterized membrane protein YphA (DoxX/SURF4 family)